MVFSPLRKTSGSRTLLDVFFFRHRLTLVQKKLPQNPNVQESMKPLMNADER